MLSGRVPCRRRRSLRCCVVLFVVLVVQGFFLSSLNVRLFHQSTDNFDSVFQSFMKPGRRNASERVCQDVTSLKGSRHADVYTYDLPDITDYSFVKGKRFKEYVIPVKTEQEAAYGPDLDPVTVILIPFSHVDPGYGNTMEGYYQGQTRKTLTHLVEKLDEYRDFTFQWVETVFLERWWRDATDGMKGLVRDQVQRGQFEIAQGGWVMPDEASTHYVAVVDQLLEGHQWVVEHLGVKPKNSWSNDPFGFSSTMPYLWKKSGMNNMVILRIHQAVKATLMKKKTMEFNWRPLWSQGSSENDILCHLMPYRGYWIGDVCGPYNQHICREYAFMREQPIHKVVFLTDDNIEERARILYEQYRITAEIYRRHEPGSGTELVLPMYLGEDFSYTTPREYELIYKNFDRLMKFINQKKEWKMTFKFGTTDEYFSKLREYQGKKTRLDGGDRFPTLSGDFFPYSDYQNDYWTGYYTTRPFNKQFSREIQSLVRMADILHTYTHAYSRADRLVYPAFKNVSGNLRTARRDLGMFLHHDGITGTSVLPVISDFQDRLLKAYNLATNSIAVTISVLMGGSRSGNENWIKDTKTRPDKTSVSTLQTLSLSHSGSKLLVVNSVGKSKESVITVKTDSSSVEVLDAQNNQVKTQVTKDTSGVLLSFIAVVPAFGIHAYSIKPLSGPPTAMASVTHDAVQLTIENDYLKLEFDENTGHLSAIIDKQGSVSVTSFKTSLLAYNSARSGAYIFAPGGSAERILPDDKPDIVVQNGHVYSELRASYRGFTTTYRLTIGAGQHCKGIVIKTELDMKALTSQTNKEVILRFESDVSSGKTFYTDQNGFQLMGRKNYPDRPIEQNYYPLTSMAVIEDATKRLTLHTGQPHGFASLSSGWMEVMLDRIVSRDDDKGLGQGIHDNILTHGDFVLQIEARRAFNLPDEVKYTYPSQAALSINELVMDPFHTVFVKNPTDDKLVKPIFGPVKDELPCGVSVVGLRTLVTSTLDYNGTSVILHRKSALCGFNSADGCSSATHVVSVGSLFPGLDAKSATETSLTHLHNIVNVGMTDNLIPEPNELGSFKVTF